jgi:hypothetical protein
MTDDIWKHKDEWRAAGKDCSVLVCRHNPYGEKNGWCVYAIIHAKHPLFAKLDVGHDEDYYQIEAVSCMPLHGGCTYFERLMHERDADGKYGREWKKGDTYAFKVGCDYSHSGDEWHERTATREQAGRIFHDAEELLSHLNSLTIPSPPFAPR